MSGGHDIISTEIIPAPVRVRPEGGQIRKRTVRISRSGKGVRRIWYNPAQMIPELIFVRPENKVEKNRWHSGMQRKEFGR